MAGAGLGYEVVDPPPRLARRRRLQIATIIAMVIAFSPVFSDLLAQYLGKEAS